MEEIICMPTDWREEDGDRGLTINAWALDRDSKPCLIRIINFEPKVYIELPKLVNRRPFQWSQNATNLVFKHLQEKLTPDGPTNMVAQLGYTLYYYRRNPIMKLFFSNRKDIYKCRNLIKYPINIQDLGTIQLTMYEEEIRSYLQFLKVRNLKPSQWFRAKGVRIKGDNQISTLEHEFIVKYTDIDPIDQEESKHWIAYPKILSYDIEAFSDNPQTFPIASFAKHVSYMISCTFQQVGNKESRKRYLILMGDADPDKVTGADLIRVNDEAELCLMFTKLIEKENPDILMGFNTFTFDDKYLNLRLTRLGKEWDLCGSRLKHTPPKFIEGKGWSSNQSKNNIIDYLYFPGRINIDLLTIIRKEHKLPLYNLKYISKEFLKDAEKQKMEFDYKEMFRIYALQSKAKEYYEKITEGWISPDKNEVGDSEATTKGREEVLDNDKYISSCFVDGNIYKPIYHKNISDEVVKEVVKMYEQGKAEMTAVAEYCVRDAEAVIELFEHFNTWFGLIEMSNTFIIPIVDIYTRGQQIRAISQLFYLLEDYTVYMDKIELTDTTRIKGAYVGVPVPGLYDKVATLDFNSLYPSIIMDQNICYSTFRPESFTDVNPDQCNVCEVDDEFEEEYEDDQGDKQIRIIEIHKKHRFVKKEVFEGFIPRLLRKLVGERKIVKREMEAAEKNNPVLASILDKRQLALKVSANSLYGFMGSMIGRLPLREGGESVTATGRKLIMIVNKYLETEHNAKIIYGDTDSTMFIIPGIDDMKEYIKYCKGLEAKTSALFGLDLKLELEKIALSLFIAPKKYAMWKYKISKTKVDNEWIEGPGYGELYDLKHKDAYLLRGLLLARRDNCQFQRDLYQEVLDNLMLKKPMQETFDLIIRHCLKLLNGEIPMHDLIIIKSLGSNYKDENFHMKIFGEHLRSIGRPAVPGARLEYVIVNARDKAEKLGPKMRAPETYLERMESDEPEPIDYIYYLEHVLMNGIEQLFQVGYKDELSKMEKEQTYNKLVCVLHDIIGKGYQEVVNSVWNSTDGDLEKTIELLTSGESPIKNKAIESRRLYYGARDLFHPKFVSKPIDQLSRCYQNGYLKEYIRLRCSKEMYQELYKD